MFKKSLVQSIGLFDKVHFPQGYGEEVDFSLRAYKAGFKAYVVPSVYLYHEKTASFTEEYKKKLKKRANPTLNAKYSEELKLANEFVVSNTGKYLKEFRNRISSVYNNPVFKKYQNIHPFSVLFLYDMKSVNYDILRTQLYQINTFLNFGMKVSLGVDNDGKNNFSRNLKLMNVDPKVLVEAIRIHRNSAADADFLTSIKFNKFVESHDIIVGHSCRTVIKLVNMYPSKVKNMIVYQLNDYNMQTVHQFNKTYHKDQVDSCMEKLNDRSIFVVANSPADAKTIKNKYPKLSVSNNDLSIDQSIFYLDDLSAKLKMQNMGVKSNAPLGSRPLYITFYFSSYAYSLQSTAEYILAVSCSLIEQYSKKIHITVVNFGAVSTAETFMSHLNLNSKSSEYERRMKLFRESKLLHFFSGNDLKYGHLLRKTHVFVDVTHGFYSEQRILEAIACGALVLTKLPAGTEQDSDFYYYDKFENVHDTVMRISDMINYSADAYSALRKRYQGIVRQANLELRGVEWVVRTDKLFSSYRANHPAANVGIVL